MADTDRLSIEYRRLSDLIPLKSNSKKHATKNTISLILEFGFKDPIGYDPSLNGGKGGITEGHDRCAALKAIKKQKLKPPKGILVDTDNEWLVPVLVGVETETEAKAVKYSILHNHSTIIGAGLDPIQELKLFDSELLIEQAEYLDSKNETLGAMGSLGEILSTLNAGEIDDDPDFTPSEDIQPQLDEKKPIICPECGHKWVRE